jgi:hypothetical protein
MFNKRMAPYLSIIAGVVGSILDWDQVSGGVFTGGGESASSEGGEEGAGLTEPAH